MELTQQVLSRQKHRIVPLMRSSFRSLTNPYLFTIWHLTRKISSRKTLNKPRSFHFIQPEYQDLLQDFQPCVLHDIFDIFIFFRLGCSPFITDFRNCKLLRRICSFINNCKVLKLPLQSLYYLRVAAQGTVPDILQILMAGVGVDTRIFFMIGNYRSSQIQLG